jgi:hypothetical protein
MLDHLSIYFVPFISKDPALGLSFKISVDDAFEETIENPAQTPREHRVDLKSYQSPGGSGRDGNTN